VAAEAVGIPQTFEQCTEFIRPGGGSPTLHLESLWIQGVTITTGLVDTFRPPPCKERGERGGGTIDPTRFTTYFLSLQEAIQAYDTFARACETNAFKVMLSTEG
jgi:alcohol dehydrogenase